MSISEEVSNSEGMSNSDTKMDNVEVQIDSEQENHEEQ